MRKKEYSTVGEIKQDLKDENRIFFMLPDKIKDDMKSIRSFVGTYGSEYEELIFKKVGKWLLTGVSLEKACSYEGLKFDEISKYISEHEKLSSRIALINDIVSFKARAVIINSIESGDVKTAKWYLERKESVEFGDKKNVDHGGNIIVSFKKFGDE